MLDSQSVSTTVRKQQLGCFAFRGLDVSKSGLKCNSTFILILTLYCNDGCYCMPILIRALNTSRRALVTSQRTLGNASDYSFRVKGFRKLNQYKYIYMVCKVASLKHFLAFTIGDSWIKAAKFPFFAFMNTLFACMFSPAKIFSVEFLTPLHIVENL